MSVDRLSDFEGKKVSYEAVVVGLWGRELRTARVQVTGRRHSGKTWAEGTRELGLTVSVPLPRQASPGWMVPGQAAL